MSFQIEKFIEDKKVKIVPVGDLDIVNSKVFKDEVLKLMEENQEILIDGEKLDYMDSTGLGVLISLYKKTKSNNSKIYLTNLKPNIYKLFDITGLNNVFEII
ncbi:MAG: Anti-sigma F factor antagonist (SpoIIAA-2) / Anti-sigma B factor antagonist RsbV [Clostridiales bacterium 38_11]|nr:MAG: Anti-sigma F factor antagonist (SpoIIAA-2) / Anti-sigma B factor antagonist RsbV [Clostridiales bacterium 38_11]HBH12194.1 anti-sigma factor antagonist [Clostridiales bacterium]